MVKVTPYLEFDQEAQQLHDRVSDCKIHLTFSESAVLGYLLATPDAIVAKEALLAAGWPDRVVAATSLTQCISTLRKKLEPFTEVQLKTVARRGYQLHISPKSHVKMLAVNDAESIKEALIDVSLMVKIGGIVVALAIIAWLWYSSDYHKVIQQAGLWDASEQVDINLGGQQESLTLLAKQGDYSKHESMWQKHIAPEFNFIKGMQGFSGFALSDGNHYSLATCPDGSNDACSGENLINIAAIDKTPAGLNMIEFSELRQVMENRIRYNRLLIPKSESFVDISDVVEHHYHGDVYFPVANELLVRADVSVSLVYEEPLAGNFYSSACITDQDCLTTPIKYQVRGQFVQYKQSIGELEVDVFHVKVTQKDLIKPEVVSDSAMHFYREIRKHNIRDEEMFYYRIYRDDKTAVWVVPLLGNLVAWTKYDKVAL